MERELLNPPHVHPPQAHYSHVARAGNTLCYRNLAAILVHYGGSFRHLLKTTTYITHWGYRPLVAAARDELFPAPPYPANTLVVVQGLAEPHFLVEIEGIALLD
jgi:enamine deaminase RidA (YjgF/YER057c/UK114 family)